MEKDSTFKAAVVGMGIDYKEGENMDLGFESVFSGFESFGSASSSDLSTLVGSTDELDSTEVESSEEEDDEFMAELTRQMADYMLEEDDDNDEEKNVVGDFDSENFKEEEEEGIIKSTNSVNSSSDKESNSVVGNQSNPAFPAADHQMQPIQLYQLENQPRVPKSGTMRNKKDHQKGRGPKYNYGKGYPPYIAGSGMRAVFLGSRNASSGTGVFLPRTITPTPHQPPKKSGCSTVLIPTRVLQVLDQHFSNIKSASSGHSPKHGRKDNTEEKGQVQPQQSRTAPIDHQVSQLPQEWTY